MGFLLFKVKLMVSTLYILEIYLSTASLTMYSLFSYQTEPSLNIANSYLEYDSLIIALVFCLIYTTKTLKKR